MMAAPALLAFAFALGASSSGAPRAVETALARALALSGSEIRLADYRPRLPITCLVSRAEAAKSITASGHVAVHLFGRDASGRDCEGWAWATVHVFSRVLVTSRAVREGEPLEGAVRTDTREALEGRNALVELPGKAVAARSLPAGQALLESDQRTGPRPGDTLDVVIRVGAVEVEQVGHAVPCVRGRTCAVLPSGKRVEGNYQKGRLLVEAP